MSEAAPFVDTRQVRRNFARAAAGYDGSAVLQREVASRMLERLDYVKIEPERVLDVGCGTGGSLVALTERYRKAHVLGAEVGASRAAIHAGWIGADRQVGQTGKTVRPALYIAAGISGAIQHRVGMEGADCIIALNNDPNAPIFDFAHYAVVGDCNQILPALTRAFSQYLGKNPGKTETPQEIAA